MRDDVMWANGLDGGHVRGKDAIRRYWTHQWTQVSPRVAPLSFDRFGDDAIAVRVQQDLFDLSGQSLDIVGGLQSKVVRHVYRFKAGKVVRFDIDEAA